jgi:hypothetical protein
MSTRPDRTARRWLSTALLVLLTGCTATGGGCAPLDPPSEPTTTTSTTVGPGDGSTTTTELPTTTTTEPGGGTTTTTTPGSPGGGATPIAEVDEGDCLTTATDEVMVAEVELAECADPHDAEVYAQFILDRSALPGAGDEYPGGNELTWYAEDECRARFDAYTGHSYWTSPFDLRVVTPSFSTWDAGDRLITCLVVDPDGAPLTGTARG